MRQTGRKPRKTPVRRTQRKKSGHGLLWPLLFFAAALVGAIYFSSSPDPVTTASVPNGSPSAVEQVKHTIQSAEDEVKHLVSGDSGKKEDQPAKSLPVAEKQGKQEKRAAKAPSGNAAVAAAAATPSAPAETGRLAVVIDDAGRDLASQRVYESLGVPLTLAVMPNQVHTQEAASEWAAAGLPVIIHQPMESVSHSGMEPIVLLTTMSDEAMRTMLSDSFRQIPQAVGMNNHQGSKATTDRHTMDVVMNELHHRGLFFLDSATNTTTAADSAAAAYGVPYARNELFVDNSTDVEEIKAMIRKGARMAAGGSAIIIGHCRPNTAEAFRQMVPELKAEGIRFVYVSSLMR